MERRESLGFLDCVTKGNLELLTQMQKEEAGLRVKIMTCILDIWIMRSLWNSPAKIVIQRKLNIGVSSREGSELETKT